MFERFDEAKVAHTPFRRHAGDAAHQVLTPEGFRDAAQEITAWPGYAPTRLCRLNALAAGLGVREVLYKDEGARFGLGSFKALGGAYAALRVLRDEIARRRAVPPAKIDLADLRDGRYGEEAARITLVSATDGNHGRSLAWGCRRFGANCRIYIHAEVSEARAQAMRDLGADVVRIDGDYDASVQVTRQVAEAKGWHVVSDTSWEGFTEPARDVMTGYGVMIDEVTAALASPPTQVFLQGGVGGMAAAICAAFRQHWGGAAPRTIVVEPDLAACLFASAKADAATAVAIEEESVMAGLSCGAPSQLAWAILREEVDDFLTIPDALVAPTVRLLARPAGDDPAIEAGESAVAGLAAAIVAARRPELRAALGIDETSVLLFFGSEGITDPGAYAEMMMEAADA
ncbi:MAG: diaminopropionate ammonia-lyase [Rhodospirillales bacterium]